jgi:hypothetical protein
MYRLGSTHLQGKQKRPRRWVVPPTPAAPADPTTPVRPEGESRAELIARVRREIAAGTYDTEEKWQAALDRLCQRLQVP